MLTEREKDEYIVNWVCAKQEELGADFWLEPLIESTEKHRLVLAAVPYKGGGHLVSGILLAIITAYWVKLARQAAEEETEWGRG